MFKHTFILPEDEDIPIWRYMTFSKFMDLLSSSTLYFSRTDRFIDKFEGHVNSYTNKLIDNMFDEFENAEELSKQLKWLLGTMKSCTFVNCWHMNYSESDEMWNSYTSNGEGVVIKSTAKRLMASLYDNKVGPMHLRPIKYAKEVEEEIDQTNFVELLNYKRPEFAFEKELRVLFVYAKGLPEVTDPQNDDIETFLLDIPEYGENIPVDLNLLIEEMYVAPNAPSWFFNMVERITKPLNKPVNKSSLT